MTKEEKKKKKKKKKKKVPWYIQIELDKEAEEKARIEEEKAEAIRKQEEHEAWLASLTPEERENYDVKKAAEEKKKLWQQKQQEMQGEEEKLRLKEQERQEVLKRRNEEREERRKLAAEGKLEITGVILTKCVNCERVAYQHEQIVVGKDVFHKIGCFKCYFCKVPLKLWNYKKLEGRYYCGAHYEQFKNLIQQELTEKNISAKARTEAKLEAARVEEARLQAIKDEEERQKKASQVLTAAEEKEKMDAVRREAEANRRKIALMLGEDPGPEPVYNDSPSSGTASKRDESDSESESGSEDDGESGDDSDEGGSKEKSPEQLAVDALLQAAQDGNEAEVLAKLNSGVSINAANEEGETALHRAAISARFSILQLLIEKGASVTQKTHSSSTALHLACNSDEQEKSQKEENVKIIQKLVECPGIDIDDLDQNFNTPLILASSKGKVEVVRILLKRNARVRPKNNLGATCLHAAADSGQVDVAKQLINTEAMDYNIQDEQGYTPLHLAVMGNHDKMATLLLALGARADIPDYGHSRTPLDEVRLKSDEFQKTFEILWNQHQKKFAASAAASAAASTAAASESSSSSEGDKKKQQGGTLARIFGKKKKEDDKKLTAPSPAKGPKSPGPGRKKDDDEQRRRMEEEDRENEERKKKLEEESKKKNQGDEEEKRKRAEEERIKADRIAPAARKPLP